MTRVNYVLGQLALNTSGGICMEAKCAVNHGSQCCKMVILLATMSDRSAVAIRKCFCYTGYWCT